MSTDAERWLTREQIQEIVSNLSADDLIEAGMGEAGVPPLKAIRTAFNSAAESLPGMVNGVSASKRINVADMKWWSQLLGETVNIDSPLSVGTGSSQDSAATGE